MKRKDALWVMQMCRDRDARSDAEREAFDTAIEALKSESIFSADRPRGEWKGYNADKGDDWLRDDGTPIFLVCDKCYGTVINNGSAHWNFCPNCGADMRGEKNNGSR